MIEELQSLGLDSRRILRLREGSVGIGRAYLHDTDSREGTSAREVAVLAAATNLRRAGAHSLLLNDVNSGRQYFQEAAMAYLAADSMYGLFLQALGKTDIKARNYLVQAPRQPSDMFWLWSPEHFRVSDVAEDRSLLMFRKGLESFRTESVGVLGLPVAMYLDLFDSLTGPSEGDVSGIAISEALFPIVSVYSAAVRRAREDHYHWTRFATSFHPLEPDILGVLVTASRALRTTNRSLSEMLDKLPLRDDVHSLLRGGLGQYDEW